MFELLSKAVVESKQKVNIPKLNKEEPEEKEESVKPKKEERGTVLILFWLNHFYTHCEVKSVEFCRIDYIRVKCVTKMIVSDIIHSSKGQQEIDILKKLMLYSSFD